MEEGKGSKADGEGGGVAEERQLAFSVHPALPLTAAGTSALRVARSGDRVLRVLQSAVPDIVRSPRAHMALGKGGSGSGGGGRRGEEAIDGGEASSAHDARLAYALFEAAAQEGEASGMVGLAECHLYGYGGVRREVGIGVAWMAIAAAKGSSHAMVEVEALTMAQGSGAIRRSRSAQRMLLATLGEGSHVYKLAKACYEEGKSSGDETRLRWSAQMLRHCVRRGEARALLALGKLTLEGMGVAQSTDAAAALFERGTEKRSAACALALARLHWEKRGDVYRAYVYMRIAQSLGFEGTALSQLGEAMPPSLAARAELKAQRWLTRHTGGAVAGGLGAGGLGATRGADANVPIQLAPSAAVPPSVIPATIAPPDMRAASLSEPGPFDGVDGLDGLEGAGADTLTEDGVSAATADSASAATATAEAEAAYSGSYYYSDSDEEEGGDGLDAPGPSA